MQVASQNYSRQQVHRMLERLEAAGTLFIWPAGGLQKMANFTPYSCAPKSRGTMVIYGVREMLFFGALFFHMEPSIEFFIL